MADCFRLIKIFCTKRISKKRIQIGYMSYREHYLKQYKLPKREVDEEVLSAAFERVEGAQIWIPDREIY